MSLEEEFHRAMLACYHAADEELGLKFKPFLAKVLVRGGVDTARLLLSQEPGSPYLELKALGRLDLTLESLVANERWAELFTAEEVEEARRRLKDN